LVTLRLAGWETTRYGSVSTIIKFQAAIFDQASRYIHNITSTHSNLHILTETKVVRIIFDEHNRATGVEHVPNSAHQPSLSLSKPIHSLVIARKLVIVCAGALGTPSILERSGLGSQDVLSKLNIPLISSLPGIGENYQDHHLMLYPYLSNLQPDESLDGILAGRLDVATAMAEKNPILGWNGIDICSKLRPTAAEVAELGPEFQEQWDADFRDAPQRPVMLMGFVNAFLGDHSILPEHPEAEQYVTMGVYTAYPYSRGNIHIRSVDVDDPARFDAGFLNHPADLKKQLWAYKKQREIFRRTHAYQGEFAMGHPKFAEGSSAALSAGPVLQRGQDRSGLEKVRYSREDDLAIEDWIRGNVNTTWHSMGTCKMAPREEGGVVNGKLDVYGVTGLKIAGEFANHRPGCRVKDDLLILTCDALTDLSICPGNVGANTANTAMCIGEKAADIIAKELGLPEIVN
jgi:alcohol oxidase